MSFYQGLATTALKLITSKGQSMTWSRRVASAYDPATGAASITTTDSICRGLILDYPEKTYSAVATDGGMLVVRGDRKLLLAASGMSGFPQPEDTFLVGSDVWSVVATKAVDPAGTVLVYECQVRK
jgi:hypothetical protein